MGLFPAKPWQGRNRKRDIEKIQTITDEAELAFIANTAKYPEVALAAAQRIRDQKRLADVILRQHGNRRDEAAMLAARINEPTQAARLLIADVPGCLTLLPLICEKSLLLKVALESQTPQVSEAALLRIPSCQERDAAIQEILRDRQRYPGPEQGALLSAIARLVALLSSDAALLDAAREAWPKRHWPFQETVCKCALDNIGQEAFLAESVCKTGQKEEDEKFGFLLLSRIKRDALLEKIVLGGTNFALRSAAMQRIGPNYPLDHIAACEDPFFAGQARIFTDPHAMGFSIIGEDLPARRYSFAAEDDEHAYTHVLVYRNRRQVFSETLYAFYNEEGMPSSASFDCEEGDLLKTSADIKRA